MSDAHAHLAPISEVRVSMPSSASVKPGVREKLVASALADGATFRRFWTPRVRRSEEKEKEKKRKRNRLALTLVVFFLVCTGAESVAGSYSPNTGKERTTQKTAKKKTVKKKAAKKKK